MSATGQAFPAMWSDILEPPLVLIPWPGPVGDWWRRRGHSMKRQHLLVAMREELRRAASARLAELGLLAISPACGYGSEVREELIQAAGAIQRGFDEADSRLESAIAKWRDDTPDPEPNLPIASLGLSSRPSNTLRHNNIDTVGKLLSLPEEELRAFRTMGTGSVNEITRALADHGYI